MAPSAEPPAPAGEARGRHVVLVGLMGSGKSTVGRRVAKLLGRPFRDADDELVARTGRTIREWFDTEGEIGFRRAEAEVLRTLLADPGASVIAAGGGVVVTEQSRDALRDAYVVWLDAEPAFLASRVARKEHRPLIDDDPAATLARLHAERAGWYAEVADAVVPVAAAHAAGSNPKQRLAEQVADLVRAAEGVPA